ncbi:MAG TPA: ABC transporter permease [Anaerolineae bacterium]|nr:ABC transporter permease [Anaerolineae bacterium]
MKIIDIAIKDLLRSLRSLFLVGMAFVTPLLMAFIFSSAFGGSDDVDIATIDLAVVNLDEGVQEQSFGEMVVEIFESEQLSQLFNLMVFADETDAVEAIAEGQVDVAVIIPVDLSKAVTSPVADAEILLIYDPTLNLAPNIVRGVVSSIADGFSGTKIAIKVAIEELGNRGITPDEETLIEIVEDYSAWTLASSAGTGGISEMRLKVQPPSSELNGQIPQQDLVKQIIATVMASMMISFVFFTGTYGAESILQEEENGTLARKFISPTPISTVLAGKFLGVLVTLILQVVVLLFASSLIFGIEWGDQLNAFLASGAMVVASAGLGIFLMSLLKSMRQTGIVTGGVLTVLSMLGGLFTSGVENQPEFITTLSHFTPHGWSLDTWKLVLAGANLNELLTPIFVQLAIGAGLLLIGVVLFRKRFA